MSPIRIAVDLCQSPLKVGGLLLGQYAIFGGSKGVKLTGEGASTTKEEVVAFLEDARDIVKTFFGAKEIDAVVVVVPNTTRQRHIDDIISHGRAKNYNITQVIRENNAVSAAFVEKVKPTLLMKIAIISLSSSILDVTVVTLKPVDVTDTSYQFILEAHQAHREAIDFDGAKHHQESSGGVFGLVGGAVKTLIVDPFEKAFDVLKHILGGLKIEGPKVEKVVFVGKASTSEKVRQVAKESFPGAEVWEYDPEEVAVYGAAFLSFVDRVMPMHHKLDPNVDDSQESPAAPLG